MSRRVTFKMDKGEEEEQVKSKPGIIEFQAFRGNDDRFIIKELVFLDMNTSVPYSFLFKPPCSFSSLTSKAATTNRWISKHFHHIDWYDGFTSYTDLYHIMHHFSDKFTIIYTKGLEKKRWIEEFTHVPVNDVELDKNYKYTMENVCICTKSPEHEKDRHCALKNAYKLASYLQSGEVGSGGSNGGYISEEQTGTWHEYYSRFRDDNISQQEDEEDDL